MMKDWRQSNGLQMTEAGPIGDGIWTGDDRPLLTLAIIHSCELPLEYLSWCFDSLREWNEEGLKDVQVIVITQRWEEGFDRLCGEQPFLVTLRKSDQSYASNGYPIWDVMADLRQIAPEVRGRYFCPMHSEFIWCRDRLRSTVEYLRQHSPYLALGNLRRPGTRECMPKWKFPSCDRALSDGIVNAIKQARENGEWERAAWAAELTPSISWMYWSPEPQPSVKAPWLEDVFFADWDWLNAWKALEHGGRLPFQDVYDLMDMAVNQLTKHKLIPAIHRVPQETCRLMHAWHPKLWLSWVPEVRDWFFAREAEWRGTQFADKRRWDLLLGHMNQAGMPRSEQPVIDLRRGPGGTVTRYGVAMNEFLVRSGQRSMISFYGQFGQLMRKKVPEVKRVVVPQALPVGAAGTASA